jgi:hypothetical protein
MALTKARMAETLFDELGLNKREAKELVELFFEEIRDTLSSGDDVKLSGFGRNPHFGPARGNVPSWAKTQGAGRSLCWNPAITVNSPRYRANGISRSGR